MTGKVKAYYYPHIRDRLYRHTIIIMPGQIAIASHSMAGEPTSYATMLTTDPGVLRATEAEFQAYLALCRPMLNTYSEPQKLFQCFMKFLSPQGFRIQKLISLSAVTAPFELVADSIGKREDRSLKARFNVEGNRMMEELAGELDFDFKRNGSLVLCFDEKEKPGLEELYEKGCQNGVPGLAIISGDQAREMEPNVSDSVVAALYAPSGGIVCPFGLTIALAENACDNGVEFCFLTEVKEIRRTAGGYELETENRRSGERAVMTAKYVIDRALSPRALRSQVRSPLRPGPRRVHPSDGTPGFRLRYR